MLLTLHHLQLAMPEGQEDRARAFYAGVLGLTEVAKPLALAGRGGVWFESGEVRVHLGVEMPFQPALKAHPAFTVQDIETLQDRLRGHGYVVWPDTAVPDVRRFYTNDPFGNRLEFLQAI